MLAGNILIWSSGSFFKLILVIGRIHSLPAIGLKSCFLAVSASKSWDSSQLLEVTLRSIEAALKEKKIG